MPYIRAAGINDIPVINHLAHRIWPIAYKNIISPEQLAYMLALLYSPSSLENQMVNLKHRFLLVEEENENLGFASFSDMPDSKHYRLHKLYVLPHQQKKGLGKMLLEKVMDIAKIEGASFLELNVNRQNEAQFFYEKLGFIIEKEEDIDIGNGYFMNDFVMGKAL